MKTIAPEMLVIMITAYADIDLAIRSLKEGASDFVVKPWHNEKLIETMKEALKKKENSNNAGGFYKNNQDSIVGKTLLGESVMMHDIFVKVKKIAPTDANILILGENGTGKELIAQAIHQQSLRQDKPFIKVDIGALTDSLFGSELFGHKKGAFTDAKEDRRGRFEEAEGGTLFLDEIGNISVHQQAKLLSVLQNRQVIRLGSNQPIPIDIRLICATNLPLKDLSDENRFRKDLIYRINTVEINLPPLRERIGDIELLSKHFMTIYGEKYHKPYIELSKKALDKMCRYHFPGNVRELQYAIERAVIMSEGDVIEVEDIIFSPLQNLKSLQRTISCHANTPPNMFFTFVKPIIASNCFACPERAPLRQCKMISFSLKSANSLSAAAMILPSGINFAPRLNSEYSCGSRTSMNKKSLSPASKRFFSSCTVMSVISC